MNELGLWNPVAMDVRCAFVLLLALVVMSCSGKPTEKAQPTTGGNLHKICIKFA